MVATLYRVSSSATQLCHERGDDGGDQKLCPNAHEKGKKKYDAFHNERIVNKTLKQCITEPINDLDHKHAT